VAAAAAEEGGVAVSRPGVKDKRADPEVSLKGDRVVYNGGECKVKNKS
jgi:hypothetical protein